MQLSFSFFFVERLKNEAFFPFSSSLLRQSE